MLKELLAAARRMELLGLGRTFNDRASWRATVRDQARLSQPQNVGPPMRKPLAGLAEMTITKGRDPFYVEREVDCPVCDDARFVRVSSDPQHPLFGEPVPCVCVKEHRFDDLLRRAEIPPRYSSMTLETFDKRANVHAYELCLAWDGTRNLVLAGDTGRGKTHLAVGLIRREIERGKPARFAQVKELLEDIRRRYSDDWQGESAQDFEARIARWPVLLIDDLGAERPTAWVLEHLTGILEQRLDRELVTIVTTNLQSREAIERHFGGDIEAQRLASRLGAGRYEWVKAMGPDMREMVFE